MFNVFKKQKNRSKVSKKTMAVILSTIMAGSGAAGITSYLNSKNNDIAGNSYSSSADNEDKYAEFNDLTLIKSFDMDKDSVRERAKEIYELSEKDYTVEDIMNLIYMVNEKYSDIIFEKSATDIEKYQYLQTLITGINTDGTNSLFDDNIKDEVNHGELIKSGEKDLETLDQNDEYIYAYMLDSKDIENYEKQLEASLAKIVNEQKRLIETNATLEELESNANTYYDFVSEKIYGNKDLSDTFMWNIDRQISQQNPLFTMFLSKEKVEDLDKQHKVQAEENKLGFEITDELGLDTSNLEDCKEYTTRALGNHFNSKEAAEANAKQTTKKENKVIYQGGKKHGTVTEKKKGKETTTAVRTETHINTEGMTEGTTRIDGNKVELTTNKKGDLGGTSTSKGGQEVSTSIRIETDPALNTTKKSQTTATTTTKHEDEIYMDEKDYQDSVNSLSASSTEKSSVNTKSASTKGVTNPTEEKEVYLNPDEYSSLNENVKSKMTTSTNTNSNYNPFVVGFSAAVATGGIGAIWLAISDKKKKEELLAQRAASEAAELSKTYVDELEKINKKNKIIK